MNEQPEKPELLDDWWACPHCGASDDSIERVEDERATDGIVTGYDVYWSCCRCGRTFDEPTHHEVWG